MTRPAERDVAADIARVSSKPTRHLIDTTTLGAALVRAAVQGA